MIDNRFIETIAQRISVRPEQVSKAIELLDDGATVSFIARYRKDVTDNLSETQLDSIDLCNDHYKALIDRRKAIIKKLRKQGILNDKLQAKIESCRDNTDLDDISLRFRNKHLTKALIAHEKGLGPLADLIWAQSREQEAYIVSSAFGLVSPEKAISSTEEALDGAQDILVEQVFIDPDARKAVRDRMLEEGSVVSHSTKNAGAGSDKFATYHDFSEPAATIPSHRLLAILRGVKAGFLRMDIAIDDERMIADLLGRFVKNPNSGFQPYLQTVIQTAYRHHLRPAVEHDVVRLLRKRAEDEAIKVFRENLEHLLLTPPAGPVPVMGIDTGKNGVCALVVIDGRGALAEHKTLSYKDVENNLDDFGSTLSNLVKAHSVKGIALGTGSVARNMAGMVRRCLSDKGLKQVFCLGINDAGTAAFAGSEQAHTELPELDSTAISAASIARRLQDPLTELVKVEPRNLGVGQYQHEVSRRRLCERLHRTVELCVNRVGVDLNTAPVELLRYVSGLGMGTAQHVVAYRREHGPFKSREQLLEVDGIGSRTYQQCAGFVRVRDGDTPLDATRIHPESYPVVDNISQALGVTVQELCSKPALVEQLDLSKFEGDAAGRHTLQDIRRQLLHPWRDLRGKFRPPRFIDGVTSIEDVREGIETDGIVTNVTDFGAFVDIGVTQDGLVHLSELANYYVQDARAVVKVGRVVRVKVLKVETDPPRISLSMKAAARPAKSTQKGRPDGKHDEKSRNESADARRKSGVKAQDERRRPRKPKQKREQKKPDKKSGPKPSGESLNTQLADQLAAIRDRFSS